MIRKGRSELGGSANDTSGKCPICGAAHSALEPCLALPGADAGQTQAIGAGGEALGVCAPPGDDEALIGQTLGNFRIVRMLGRGGMGVVFLGEHVAIGSRVAIKFLHRHLAADQSLVERFFAEAKATNLIGHENIVNIFDLSLLPPNRYYLIMEYLEGQPLSSMIGRPLDPGVAVPIFAQACDALHAAHTAGVVHRDLKPENIFLVRREGCPHFVKLVDFGIAKLSRLEPGQTVVGGAVGTPEFMAPEQWTGQGIDRRADIYALGVLAYLLATGRLPFRESAPLAYFVAHSSKAPEPPSTHNPKLPPAVDEIILKALAKKPEDRFQTALEMRAALLGAFAAPATPQPVRAPTPRPFYPRHAASLPAKVSWQGAAARELTTEDLSRGGVFLCCEPPMPALFTRVEITLLHPEGTVDCEGDVVRHVAAEQAQAWGMKTGFAVQFTELNERARFGIERLVRGRPPSETPKLVSVDDDPKAEKVLDYYRKRIAGDHYGLLGLAPDAECSEVRSRARAAEREVAKLKERPISARQREQVEATLARIAAATSAVGTPRGRAEHDASRGNFRGVARCLAAGLSVDDLGELRRKFLSSRPKNEASAQVQVASANAYLASGEPGRGLASLERALELDPLSLGIHQKYWALRRQYVQGSGGQR